MEIEKEEDDVSNKVDRKIRDSTYDQLPRVFHNSFSAIIRI